MGIFECPCGDAHEPSAVVRDYVTRIIRERGRDVMVASPSGTWRVPRIYIAVHGLKADELPELAERYGFEPVWRKRET